jgi:adenosylcobinamide-phosphate synthase
MSWPLFGVAAAAAVVERFVGYPVSLQRQIGHPVQWMGRLIAILDASLNDPLAGEWAGRLRGTAALAILLVTTFALAYLAHLLARALPAGPAWEVLLATPFIAQKSLRDHVGAVLHGLETSLARGQTAVSAIVGRDPLALDESGVAKGAIESLAENTSDGIVAPLFWLSIGGLPGIALYKAINTADSMIGHKSPEHLHFGWAAARLDDLVNLPCSRLSALLFAGAAALRRPASGRNALKATRRDAETHASPNAGWPEAAMAGALGIRLGGPRSYDRHVVDLPAMGDGRQRLEANDIRRALDLYDRALNLLAAVFIVLAIVF